MISYLQCTTQVISVNDWEKINIKPINFIGLIFKKDWFEF